MRINIVMPSLLGGKTRQQRHFLLRRNGIDLTDLFTAALTLWQRQTEGDPLERIQQIADLFSRFMENESHYETAQRIATVIDKALADIQNELAVIIDPYIEHFFADQPVKLRLVKTMISDLVIEVKLDETTNEPRPPLPNRSTDG